jgi:hypothetical protein
LIPDLSGRIGAALRARLDHRFDLAFGRSGAGEKLGPISVVSIASRVEEVAISRISEWRAHSMGG